MSKFVMFKGYGLHVRNITVDVDRVTHFYAIDYNGNHGTELILDSGNAVQVGHYETDVKQTIEKALQEVS